MAVAVHPARACIVLYIVGGIADRYGIRAGLLIMVPIFLIGAWILASALACS